MISLHETRHQPALVLIRSPKLSNNEPVQYLGNHLVTGGTVDNVNNNYISYYLAMYRTKNFQERKEKIYFLNENKANNELE